VRTGKPRRDAPTAPIGKVILSVTPSILADAATRSRAVQRATGATGARHGGSPAAAAPSPPFNQCPAIGADASCGVLVVVSDSGIQVLVDPAQGPYDGTDDTLVGVLNSSSGALGSLGLAATNAPIFGFDGDGLCTFAQNSGCPFGPTGYEGPDTSFSNITSSTTAGVVNFPKPLAPGGSTYFSLEVALTPGTLIVATGPTAAEQGGGPNRSMHITTCSHGAPVNCATGTFWHDFQDFNIPGRGIPLEFTRTYVSANAGVSGPLGFGWVANDNMALSADSTGNVTVHQENGSTVTFNPITSGGFAAPPRVLAALVRNSDGTYTFIRNGDRTRYVFSAGGQLAQEIDRNGYVTSLAYTGGQLTAVTDPGGRSLSFRYAGTHIVKIADPAGRTESFTYDASGNLATATDPAGGTWSFTYGPNHLLLAMTDPRGGTTTNTYDSAGRVVSQTDPLVRKTTWAYSGDPTTPAGGTTTMTVPNGNVTTFQYQNLELLTETRGAGTSSAATTRYTYDPATLGLASVTDPNGQVSKYTYDSHGNRLSATDPLNRTITYTYDPFDDLTSVTDPTGVTTTRTYDTNGNLLRTSRPLVGTGLSASTVLSYADAAHPGDVTSVTDPAGNTTKISYDSNGNAVRSTDPAGNVTISTYDVLGRIRSTVAPNGNIPRARPGAFTSKVSYDALDDPISIIDAAGGKTSYVYDGNRNRTVTTDADSNTTRYTFDLDNELVKVTRADGTTLRTGYDGDGNVVTQTDGLGQTTRYSYDALDRKVAQIDPLGRRTSYTYDGLGKVTSVLDPQSQTTTLAYDAASQLTTMTFSDGKTPNVTYAYDGNGQRVSMTDASGTTSYAYDSLSRLIQVVNGAGQRVGYGYDLNGRLTSISYPGAGRTVTRTYDRAGRLTSITDWIGHRTSFGYDADGNLVSTSYPNGTAATNRYDAADRLSRITDRSGDHVFLDLEYRRDAAGQVTGVDHNKVSYDALNRQVGWGDDRTAYEYNAADELTKIFDRSLRYNAADEVLSLGTTRYAYDARGNRTQQSGDDASVRLGYDQSNRLVSFGTTAAYGYNGDGLRVSKKRGEQQPELFTWDVAQGLPLIIQDGAVSYVTGPGGYPLEQIAADGKTTLYYHQDKVGSTRALTDSRGRVVKTYQFDPYGRRTGSSGKAANPFQFAGQYLDSETGLYYVRARYYDPATAQFISRDPISSVTGQCYNYAANAPLNGTDPTGQSCDALDTTRFPLARVGGSEIATCLAGSAGSLLSELWNWRVQCRDALHTADLAAQEEVRLFGPDFATGPCEGFAAAFRHTYWSALMAHRIGVDAARAYGDAHEDDSADAQLQVDRAYHNNAIGRQIGNQQYPGSDGALEQLILNDLLTGKLDTRSAVGLPSRCSHS
jgi:RHS repeat-associated protein